jgi:tetratricopeptide (TPR) repeat protein
MSSVRRRIVAVVAALGLAAVLVWWAADDQQHVAEADVPLVDAEGVAAPVVEALLQARETVLADPADHGAWYHYAVELQSHGFYELAAEAYRQAEVLRPDDPRPPYLVAILGPAIGFDIEQILEHYERAHARDPRYPPLHVRKGIALAGAGRLEEARAALTRAVELDPSYPMAHRQLGLVALDQGDLPTALLHLEFAAELVEDDHITWVGLAKAYQQRGWTEKAQMAARLAATTIEIMSYRDSVYEDVLARNVGPVRQLNLARHYARVGAHRAAIEALQIALRGMGDTAEIHSLLAASYRALGENELATRHQRRAEATAEDARGVPPD